jgi:hypothetical protein
LVSIRGKSSEQGRHIADEHPALVSIDRKASPDTIVQSICRRASGVIGRS